MDVDLSDLRLDELADGAEAAVRPAAQEGAQYFYDQVRANVRKLGRKTGNLERAIYQAFSRNNSGRTVAQYHVTWRRGSRGEAADKVAGGQARAPHGHLVEFGHWQRYVVYVDKRGEWKTAIRPSMKLKSGKGYRKPPPRRASQAAKDAYYVPLKGGPKWVPPQSFVRSAMTPGHKRAALNRMVDRFWFELERRGLL